MSHSKAPIRLLVSDELGQLKVVQAPDKEHMSELKEISRWGEADKSRLIQSLAISPYASMTYPMGVVVLGRVNGTVDVMNAENGKLLYTIPTASHTTNNKSNNTNNMDDNDNGLCVQSLHILPNSSIKGTSESKRDPPNTDILVLSCTKSGIARLHNNNQLISTWNVPNNVCCTAYDDESNRFAVGSQGTELRVYSLDFSSLSLSHMQTGVQEETNNNGDDNDINTQLTNNEDKDDSKNSIAELVYSAKGGKPNMVGLVDMPWNTAVDFIPGSKGTRIIVGTGYHKLRLYDSNIGKRPQIETSFGETRITALAPELDGQRCWVGNGQGQVEVYDFTAKLFVGAIKGIAGSVRAMCIHKKFKWIASVGLDRFLRVHTLEGRKGLGKDYLKTQLTGVVFCPNECDDSGNIEDTKGKDLSKEKRKHEEEKGLVLSEKTKKKKKR